MKSLTNFSNRSPHDCNPMTTRPSTSIALCSYNGEPFIGEQLESFLQQSILPDELIICDDGSSDRTIEIIETFSQQAPFPVNLICNKNNLGSTKNFEQAISLCQGEIIFLSDQDDIWHPKKIAITLNSFTPKQTVAVFSNANIVDADNRGLGYDLWSSAPFEKQQQQLLINNQPFEALLKHNFVTGATLAFRQELRPQILPIPEEWVHDGWIALLLSIFGDITAIDQPLINYRQHAANQIGGTRLTLWQRLNSLQTKQIYSQHYLDEAARYQQAYRHLEPNLSQQQKTTFLEKIEHCRNRGRLKNSRISRLPTAVTELVHGRYHRYAYGWYSVANDLLYHRIPSTKPTS